MRGTNAASAHIAKRAIPRPRPTRHAIPLFFENWVVRCPTSFWFVGSTYTDPAGGDRNPLTLTLWQALFRVACRQVARLGIERALMP